ncbi:IQ domain-containing protein C [Dicentrarchus labrax]|uniref:IQ motif containing C n=1 Tax=Dicentrarchus labrax TaxID=13489 RepID=A0A8P4GDQ1_DICLA|nr:IQ domain-containing protein C [Dicentrarchus labrax]
MDRSKWEKILTCFQASARGYLVRNEVRRARQDFEDIVRETDGGLTHLEWRETVIPIPHFTDTDGPCLRPSGSGSKPSNPGLDVCDSPISPAASSISISSSTHIRGERRSSCSAGEDRSRERRFTGRTTGLPSKDSFPSNNVRGDAEGHKGNSVGAKDGGVMESTGDTTVWSSLELDMSYGHSHKGPRQYCLAQEVPCTPEALRLHRNTLTMELLWLQQAIDSRKKYLSLKDRLSVS